MAGKKRTPPEQPSLFSGDLTDTGGEPWDGSQLAALLGVPGLGSVGVLEVVRACPSPSHYERHRLALVVSSRTAAHLPDRLPSGVDAESGVELIGIQDEKYPELLSAIPDPPPVLWVRGSMPSGALGLAVVGTRHPSPFGKGAARAAAEAALEAGMTVISGLALGVDTVAHSVAVEASAPTVAVLAGQLTSPSPASNRSLSERILETGGALVSELPPNAEVQAYGLVRRNRIQSGLSAATFIAETGVPGGTMHTARFALEQRRPLIVAVPGTDYVHLDTVAGNLALLDEAGCSPDLLSAVGELAALIENKKPVADFQVRTSEELPYILASVMEHVGRRTP